MRIGRGIDELAGSISVSWQGQGGWAKGLVGVAGKDNGRPLSASCVVQSGCSRVRRHLYGVPF